MPEPGARAICPARRDPSPSPLRGFLLRRSSGRAGLSNDSFHALCVCVRCVLRSVVTRAAGDEISGPATNNSNNSNNNNNNTAKGVFWSVKPGEPDREPARESENFGVFIGGQGTRQRTRQRIREVWTVYRRPGNPTENAAGKDEWNG